MGKWQCIDRRIVDNKTGWISFAMDDNHARVIVKRHEADIDALTARAEAAEKRLASVLDRVGFYVSDSCYCQDLDGDRCEHCDFLRDLRRFAKGDE